MRDKILISRYESRRLYNTRDSAYVTLDDVSALIGQGHDVEIRDRKTDEDVTRQYLLQIIAEREARGEQLLPVDLLTDLVRSYGSSVGTMLPDFLSMSLETLKRHQEAAAASLSTTDGGPFDPVGVFGTAAEFQRRNAEMVSAMMSAWMPRATGEAAPEGGQTRAEPRDADATSDEITAIRDELGALKAKLDRLQEKGNPV